MKYKRHRIKNYHNVIFLMILFLIYPAIIFFNYIVETFGSFANFTICLLLIITPLIIFWLYKNRPSSFVFLDIETTGLGDNPNLHDEILEIAVIDYHGNILVNTLVKPKDRKAWRDAEAIHHITPAMIKNSPHLEDILEVVEQSISGKNVVIYNAAFERKFLSNVLRKAKSVQCCMLRFSKHQGEKTKHGDYRWFKLQDAAQRIGFIGENTPHRALSDTYVTKAVWKHTSFILISLMDEF